MEFQSSFNLGGEQSEPSAEKKNGFGELLTIRKEVAAVVQEDMEARSRLPHLPTFEEILEESQRLGKEAGQDEFFFRRQVREGLNYDTLHEQHWETSKLFADKAGEIVDQYPWKYTFTTENTNGGGNSLYFVDEDGHSQRFKSSVMGERELEGAFSSMMTSSYLKGAGYTLKM